MSHLGERLSALVDGELSGGEYDRALSHLVECETCRFEVEMLRSLKRRLNGMHGPEPPLDFMGRLSELTGSDPGAPPPGVGQSRGFLPGLWRRQRGPAGPGRPGGSPHGGSDSDTHGGPPDGGEGGAGPLGPPSPPFGGGLGAPGRAGGPDGPANGAERGAAGAHSSGTSWPYVGRARYAFAGLSLAAVALGTAFLNGEPVEQVPGPGAQQPSVASDPAARTGPVPPGGQVDDGATGFLGTPIRWP